jgi:Domain of unknown function (DUF4203)
MLPASFQLPAALILLVGGLLSCFAGYRVFRVVLGIYGFILGALLASSAVGPEQTLWMIGAALVGGLLGALIMIAAYFVGVALIGAGLGAGAAHLLWSGMGSEPGMIAVIVLSILGALLALWMQRYVIIVATAFGGAQTAIVGGVALFGDGGAADAAARSVYRVYPLDPLPATQWDLIGWLILGLVGVGVQLAITSRGTQAERRR